jgi:hypothetical protein
MWRDIDSLRKQNESTKKEIESMRRKSKQTEIETEQLKSETEMLRRQNKALALIESIDLDALLNEATIPSPNDSKHPEAQLNPELLEEKLVALGCDVDDIPFLVDLLGLSRVKGLSPPHSIHKLLSQEKKIPTLDMAIEDAFMEREFKLSEFDEQGNSSQLPIRRQQQHRSLAEHAYRNTFNCLTILVCRGPEFRLERVLFPFEDLIFQCPPECSVEIWGHGRVGPELLEAMGAEDLLIEEADTSVEPIGSSWIEAG